uniref:Uncharacterized protein n=1 Tax=Rhizophora mucronata TaxID=61149 RepID=A0A2P2JRX3_RHIMU
MKERKTKDKQLVPHLVNKKCCLILPSANPENDELAANETVDRRWCYRV